MRRYLAPSVDSDEEESEADDGVGKPWARIVERPWGPPLTHAGQVQTVMCDRAVVEHTVCLNRRLPRIMAYPCARCLETGAGVAKVAGVIRFDVEWLSLDARQQHELRVSSHESQTCVPDGTVHDPGREAIINLKYMLQLPQSTGNDISIVCSLLS